MNYFLSILSLIIVSACKESVIVQNLPDNALIKPGDYKLTGATSYTIEGVTSSEPVSGTLTVFTGPEGQYYFLERIAGRSPIGFQVQVNNLNLLLQSVQDYTKVGNTAYYGWMDKGCTGKLESESIVYDRYANTEGIGLTTPTGEQIRYTKKIRKHVHVVAAR
ncbi:hypothetical protein GCM10028806_01690 [Spirosoma terrae]|uniref:Uncharacterized protein n=1 Tax=Spirosoma terrae TaxID=1968276 RepID=A0A6L9LEG5_9BACT|nr:hypothetical protein [Spirosoma terrae]NDU97571.1 hypothetical protein [Spirosoma terrae]